MNIFKIQKFEYDSVLKHESRSALLPSHPEYFFGGYDLVEWHGKNLCYVEKCFGTAVPPNRKVNGVPPFPSPSTPEVKIGSWLEAV